MAWLPAKTRTANVEEVHARVAAELAKDCTKFLPRYVVEAFTQVQKWLQALMSGGEVKLTKSRMIPLAMGASVQLRFFLRFKPAGALVECAGDEAMAKLLADCQQKHEKGKLVMADVADVVTFKFVVPREKLQQANTLISGAKTTDKEKAKLPSFIQGSPLSKKKQKSALSNAQTSFD